MRRTVSTLVISFLVLSGSIVSLHDASALDAPAKKVACEVESSLKTKPGRIRQFAFDGDAKSYFESDKPVSAKDHFTLTFDEPVTLTKLQVLSGRPDGPDGLTNGIVEYSLDGKAFEPLTKFKDGIANSSTKHEKVKALRVRATEDLKHPLVLREFTIESTPPVAAFKYPVEFVLDYADAPEMQEWLEKAAKICERNYGMICEELMSPGFKPLTVIYMALKKDYTGVAEAGGDHIKGSVKWFKANPNDFGAMVHETVHTVQQYRSRRNPGWLVEGVADYIRFFKYEPGKIGRMRIESAKYNGSYRVTAAFLAFVTEKYSPTLVTKLNTAMREGKYTEDIWKEITGKPVEELNQEWRRSLEK